MATYGGGMPQIDFSILGDLGKTYSDAKLKAGRERSLAELGQGAKIEDVSRSLFQAGDIEGGLSLAKLADAQALRAHNISRDERDFALRKQEIGRTQSNADRAYGLQEKQFGLAQETAREKPAIVWQEDASGVKVPYRVDPKNATEPVRPLDTGQPAQPGNPYAVGGPMKEHEGKSALFADRAATAHQAITKFEKINREPGGTIGATVEKVLPEGVSNILVSGERGQLMNSKRAFINALLRRESGAAIAATEFSSYDKEYFPQLGDTDDQINAKRKHRAEVIKGLARESGRSYRPNYTIDEESGFVSRGAAKDQARAVPPGGGGSAPRQAPQEPTGGEPLAQARDAIAKGADRNAVIKRLRENNIDPTGL